MVDDDPNISEVVARYLEREGYVVDVALDGDEALKKPRSHPPPPRLGSPGPDAAKG